MHDQFDVTLEDSDLLGEVELTTNLIIAASESDERLTPDEIDPTKWAEIRARTAKMFPTNDTVEVPESALFKCSKCKSRRITYYELQTRSADEPVRRF